jgi:hypothetical protein
LLSEFSLTQHVQDATHIKDLLVTRSSSNIIWQLKVENGLAYHGYSLPDGSQLTSGPKNTCHKFSIL